MGSVLSSVWQIDSQIEIGREGIHAIANGETEAKLGCRLGDITALVLEVADKRDCSTVSSVICKLPNLKVIEIRGKGSHAGNVEPIVSQLPGMKLKRLDLSGNHVTRNAAVILGQTAAEGRIKRLYLRRCDLSSTKLRSILQGLRGRAQRVKLLDLSGNDVDEEIYRENQDLLDSDRIIWQRNAHRTGWHKIRRNTRKILYNGKKYIEGK